MQLRISLSLCHSVPPIFVIQFLSFSLCCAKVAGKMKVTVAHDKQHG